MKLNSARQAWHDCYYSTSKCQMDVNIELARLGAYVQHSSKLNTCNAAAHQVQAGLIQSAIARLPPPLQMLGHWLYAPNGFIPAGAENIVWKTLAILCGLGVNDEDSDHWYLARCSMHRYRELAWQRPDEVSEFRSPRQIKKWLWEQHGIDIETRRWGRDYGRFWDRALRQLDELDKKALVPIQAVISEANDDPDYFSEWGPRVVAMGG